MDATGEADGRGARELVERCRGAQAEVGDQVIHSRINGGRGGGQGRRGEEAHVGDELGERGRE
ncbi:hypothetical protein U9M48_036753 [Paspalum notatum var. saurae]|uniref:Uncharacterized protein n=1 Tax=Paspalum notatum var. saurae TaxID=547442 RepID=A0AAQ3UI85_PASNO